MQHIDRRCDNECGGSGFVNIVLDKDGEIIHPKVDHLFYYLLWHSANDQDSDIRKLPCISCS